MKKYLLLLAMLSAIIAVPVIQTGCSTAPSNRVEVVATLLSVGQTAEMAVFTSGQLYRDGKITLEQAKKVIDLYDNKFMPAFRIAVNAANSDLNAVASKEVMELSNQLFAYVIQLKTQ